MPGDMDGDRVRPSLIRAVADNGVQGYLRLSDLEGRTPSSPEEALRQAAEVRVLPVYGPDGRTVVGQLTESPGASVELTADEAGR